MKLYICNKCNKIITEKEKHTYLGFAQVLVLCADCVVKIDKEKEEEKDDK